MIRSHVRKVSVMGRRSIALLLKAYTYCRPALSQIRHKPYKQRANAIPIKLRIFALYVIEAGWMPRRSASSQDAPSLPRVQEGGDTRSKLGLCVLFGTFCAFGVHFARCQ